MKKIYLPFIALIAGFVNAFLTAGVHSLFFVLLPLLAFAFGYFSLWRRGLLSGFLLFAGYTFAISLIWYGIDPNLLYPLPYIAAFIAGGFGILLIGALAPLVRKGVKRFSSIATLVILIAMTGWCGYTAMPHYGYYYQVVIHSQKGAPHKLIQLMPKSDVTQVNTVTWQRRIGPVTSHESLVVERFNVPVKIVQDTPGPIKLTLWNRTDRSEAVNFTYSKSYPYNERGKYELQTGNEWVFLAMESTVFMDIRGISD